MSTKTTVIYHSVDFDGIFCREIARKFLPDAELIGWDYNDAKLHFPAEGQVYVLDLSPDCFNLTTDNLPLREDGGFDGNFNRLVWIDHHKSAIDKYPAHIPGYRIDGVAACRLAWQYFSKTSRDTKTFSLPTKQDFIDRKVSEPLAVRLAGEYDIWDKRDPRAELFQHGLRSCELSDSIWIYLLHPENGEPQVRELLAQGEAVQYAQTQQNASIIKELGFTFQWEELTWLACNHARYNSLLFTAGIKPEHDALFGFKWTGKGWSISLYHAPGKEHHDLSAIAVKYGGGGHRGACGFRADKLPFIP